MLMILKSELSGMLQRRGRERSILGHVWISWTQLQLYLDCFDFQSHTPLLAHCSFLFLIRYCIFSLLVSVLLRNGLL